MKKSYLKFIAITAYLICTTLYAETNNANGNFDSLKNNSPFGDRKPAPPPPPKPKPVESKPAPKPVEQPKAKLSLDFNGITKIGNELYATFVDKSKTPNISFTIPQNKENVYGYIFKSYNEKNKSVEIEFQKTKYTLKLGEDNKTSGKTNSSSSFSTSNSNSYNNSYNNYNWDDDLWDDFDWDWDDDLAFDGFNPNNFEDMGTPNWNF